MKYWTCILAVVLFCTTNQVFSQNLVTFESYKRLSKEERMKVAQNGSDEFQMKCFEWEQRLKMGEDVWRKHQETRLSRGEGLAGISQLLVIQNILWGEFYEHSLGSAVKKPNATKDSAASECKPILDELAKYQDDLSQDQFFYLAKLAPSEKVSELNAKASALYTKWSLRFPTGGTRVVTQKDLAEIDADAGEIRKALRQLPQRTKEQQDAAIEALPPELPSRDWPVRDHVTQ